MLVRQPITICIFNCLHSEIYAQGDCPTILNSRRKCNHGRHKPIYLLIETPAVVFIGEARENQLPISFRA
ncbi:hypothetical protein, partial [Chlorobium limicola]|uniref:hypothetical protein n=1 Tax=Chlorobium limicola TaxID=1092 RepID=UPI001F2002DB